MKRAFPFVPAICVLICVLICALLCGGCKKRETIFDHTQPYDPTQPVADAPSAASAEETQSAAAQPTTAPQGAEPQSTEPQTTAPLSTEPRTAAPETTQTPAETAVDLSIRMPAARGSMQVSADPDNPYVRMIVEDRGIDASLLAAVYTVPQPGENYVFEFYDGSRTAENIRRVYLLDENNAVKSVAAADASEREQISATENWFCMNVLIRGVIFPAVKDQF